MSVKSKKEKELEERLSPPKDVCDNKTKSDLNISQSKPDKVSGNLAPSSAVPGTKEETEAPSGFETLLQASEILSLRELAQKPPLLAQKQKDKENAKKLQTLIQAASDDMSEADSEQDKDKPRFLAEHDYFAPPSLLPKVDALRESNDTDGTVSAEEDEATTPYEVFMDHNYCLPPQTQPSVIKDLIEKKENVVEKPVPQVEVKKPLKPKREYRKRKAPLKESTNINLNDIVNKARGSRELINLLPPPKPVTKFPQRKFDEEKRVFFDMYSNGIDEEDIRYLKMTYEHLLESEDPMGYWINDILWVDHPVTSIPDPVVPKKRRKTDVDYPKPHSTGNTLAFLSCLMSGGQGSHSILKIAKL